METSYGGTNNLNGDLMRPPPDTTYVVHPDVSNPLDGLNPDHVFRTDGEGRTEFAHTDALSLGGTGYEDGHLFGNAFGGGGEYANLVAMPRDVNRGSGDSYCHLENHGRAMLAVELSRNIEVTLRPTYSAPNRVLVEIQIEFRIDGGRPERKVFENAGSR